MNTVSSYGSCLSPLATTLALLLVLVPPPHYAAALVHCERRIPGILPVGIILRNLEHTGLLFGVEEVKNYIYNSGAAGNFSDHKSLGKITENSHHITIEAQQGLDSSKKD